MAKQCKTAESWGMEVQTPVPARRRHRQEDFESSLGCLARLCLKKNGKTKLSSIQKAVMKKQIRLMMYEVSNLGMLGLKPRTNG